MKKWILVAIISTMGLNVLNAQNFFKGEKAIAARVSNFDVKYSKYKDSGSQTDFIFGFKGDYFLIDDLTLTGGFDYSYVKKDNQLLGEIGCKYYYWKYLYGGLFYQGLYDFGRLNSRGKIEAGATLYIADNVFIEPAIFFIQGQHAFGVGRVEHLSQFGLAVSIGVNF